MMDPTISYQQQLQLEPLLPPLPIGFGIGGFGNKRQISIAAGHLMPAGAVPNKTGLPKGTARKEDGRQRQLTTVSQAKGLQHVVDNARTWTQDLQVDEAKV